MVTGFEHSDWRLMGIVGIHRDGQRLMYTFSMRAFCFLILVQEIMGCD
jgi:hypothetical protein